MPSLLARMAYSKRSSLVRSSLSMSSSLRTRRRVTTIASNTSAIPAVRLISISRSPVCRDASPNVAVAASPSDCQLAIQRPYTRHGRLQVGGLRFSACDDRTQRLARGREFGNLRVRQVPQGGGGRHVSDAPEAPIPVDDAFGIVGRMRASRNRCFATSMSGRALANSARASRNAETAAIPARKRP